jgi:hypothetical protein
MEKKFDCYDFDGDWEKSFGCPEKNFKMIVYGASGQGKTDFCVKFAKYMCKFTRVYYNSFEEGISRTLQKALERNNMMEVKGRIVFGDRETFDEMVTRLSRRNSPKLVVIDSRDYINLTHHQYKILDSKFNNKAFIIICWEAGGKPKGEHAKAIEYMCDIKVRVDRYIAEPRCRFGGNTPFTIWEEGAKVKRGLKHSQLTLL